MIDAWLFKEPCYLENEVQLFPLNCTRDKASQSPDSLTISVTLIRGHSVMRSISCTNIFIPHCHYEIFGYRPHPLPPLFRNSLSTHFPPFISILLPATGQLLSNLKLVKAHICTQLYFLNCVPWNTRSVGCLYIESWIILSQKGLRNSSLKKIKFFTERLSVSNILTSVANFPGGKG